MTHESLEKNIEISAVRLIKLAEERSWNKISHHMTFIISDCNEFKGENFGEIRKSRWKINRYKIPQPLDQVIGVLKNEYEDLYDVNLYVFKALRKETVIEIQYYRKSNLNPDYFEKIKDNQPMFHSKITLPGYALDGAKFDINRESGGGPRHYWNLFLYEFKYRRMMKKMEK
ncbi:hypothetical protein [Chryseobacterium vrystaatense]|uniref:Uncharacterized protein n=1 Tax=Chryseobacterium vrystaatense TaxID=307480 RepID=A0ABR4UGQ1_9FLAO|nr:hypothetical protein [Chryseobacterium vrystaatense]KFF23638.1 hypothetical protein IW16_25655 [Chryseobacterium vrystaatense]